MQPKELQSFTYDVFSSQKALQSFFVRVIIELTRGHGSHFLSVSGGSGNCPQTMALFLLGGHGKEKKYFFLANLKSGLSNFELASFVYGPQVILLGVKVNVK